MSGRISGAPCEGSGIWLLFWGSASPFSNGSVTFLISPPRPDSFWAFPPSPKMISGLLIVYSFSALILILGRMTTGNGAFSGLPHVGYLVVFYLFYHVAHALDDNFHAVLAAGITILSLESYHVWTWNQERIRQEKQHIIRLDRMREWKKG